MGSIGTSIQLYDGASATLSNIANAVSRTTQRFDDMNDHFEDAFDEGGFSSAKNGFNGINILINKIENNIDQSVNTQQAFTDQVNKSTVAESELLNRLDRIDNEIKQANNQQEKFNNSIQNSHAHIAKAESGFKGWQKAIITANQAIGLIRNTLGRLGATDMGGAFDRIDTMNRFKKTITVMTGDANLASAALAQVKGNVLGTAYGLDVASKSAQGLFTRGMSLGAATNQVRVWADAVSFYGEGTNQQLVSVVDAIGKMYSKGKVEADQLDRLFDAGIGAAEIYAKAVNKSVGSVKKDLSSGAISSANFINTVSQALDSGISAGAAKEAGGTWATTFANMRAAITRGWTNIITELDNALAQQGLPSSMEMVTMFGQKMEEILNSVADAMGSVIDVVMRIVNFVTDNMPLVTGLFIGLGIAALVAGIQAFVGWIAATWPILLIIALVTLLVVGFYKLIETINKLAGTSINATGLIAGSFLWLAALIANTFIGVINGIIQLLWTLFVEPFIGIIEWVLNVANGGFNSFGGGVANLIGQIISWFLSLGKVVTKIIDAIFGTNWTAGLSSLQDSVLKWGKNEDSITLDRNAPEIDHRFDMTDAYGKGYEWGAKLFDDESNKNKGKSPDDNLYNYGDMYNNIADTADNTGKIAKGVKISDEDLKYLHDVAEREAINRFTTAEIKVEMVNHNNVSGTRDIDGITEYLRDELEETMSRMAEGV